MNKRITALMLCFVMVFAMLATAVPTFASGGTCTYSIEADRTTVSPGDTITFTIYMQQTGLMNTLEGTLVIPDGLTYVAGSGKVEEGVSSTLNWTQALEGVAWTESAMLINGFGAISYSGTEKLALMKFQCTVDEDAALQDYAVELIDLVADDENYETKNPTCIPATITVTAAPKPADDIKLNKNTTTIYTGNTETLIAMVEPADTTDTVTWESDNTGVAEVDDTGKVTAVAPGTATITAAAGSKSASCVVTVEDAPCTHTVRTPVAAKASTCQEQGWNAYFKCNGCGQLFDSEGSKIDAIPYLPLADHSLTPVAAKAETCTEDGNMAYYICSVCGKWFEDAAGNVEIPDHNSVIVAASGHDYSEKITDDAHKKDTASDCRSHDTYWYDCSRCDKNAKDDAEASNKWYESTNAGPHSYDESDWGYKGEDGHAHKCLYDDTHDTPVAHIPGEAATETTPQTCTECGYIITPALGHVHSLTPVAAKAETCTEDGNIAYYACSGCEKWFEDEAGNVEITDHSSVIIAASGHDYSEEIADDAHKKDTASDCRSHDTYWYDCSRCDKNAKDDAEAADKWYESTNAGPHSYDESDWGYRGEDGHAHKCCYDDTHDTPEAHKPDREAPTLNDPVRCAECGYELMAALEAITVEIPFTVTVKQGGNVAPGKQTFELEIFDILNMVEEQYRDVTVAAEVETNGNGDYTGKLVIKGSEEQVNAFVCEGFFVREKDTKAANWTYSDAVWFVGPGEDETGLVYLIFPAERKTSDNGEYYDVDLEHPAGSMTFVNIYTENRTVEPEEPETPIEEDPEPTITPEEPKSPKTGDSSNLIFWIVLLFVSGGVVAGNSLSGRRRKM